MIPISVAIPTFNGREILSRCLPSVLEAVRRYPAETEILVVDDGSRDDSAAFVRRHYGDRIRIIVHRVNRGVPAAFNSCLRHSRHPWVLLLNNDTVLHPDFLSPLAAVAGKSLRFAVQGTIHPGPPGSAEQHQDFLDYRSGLLGVGTRIGAPASNDPEFEEIPYAVACAALYRRKCALALGGFDEGTFAPGYWEDADLSLRARRKGWSTVRARDSHVWHLSSETMKRVLPEFRRRALWTRNQLLFHWKNLDTVLLTRHLCLLPKQLLGALLRRNWIFPVALLWALPGAPRAFFGRSRGSRIDLPTLRAIGAIPAGDRPS